jgi:hypothetical protein
VTSPPPTSNEIETLNRDGSDCVRFSADTSGLIDATLGGFDATFGEFNVALGGFNATLGGFNATLGGFDATVGEFDATLGAFDATLGGFNATLGGFDATLGEFDATLGGFDVTQSYLRGLFGAFGEALRMSLRKGAVRLVLLLATFSGVPQATIWPPPSPASGPISTR